MAEYQLHCFAQSGNAYKPALMLELADADWEPILVAFFTGETRTPAYRALNPMGEVPVLVHGSNRISQSGVILDYLSGTLGLSGTLNRLRPETEEERREILRWTLWDNHKLTGSIAPLRFMMQFLPEPKREPAVIGYLSGRARAALAVLDAHLAERDWVAADRLTAADLSCIGYLFFTDEFGVDIADYPAIGRWRNRIAALPGWRHPYDLMPGHPLAATA